MIGCLGKPSLPDLEDVYRKPSAEPVSIHFLTIPTATFRVVQQIVLTHDRGPSNDSDRVLALHACATLTQSGEEQEGIWGFLQRWLSETGQDCSARRVTLRR
jgi:hypothetical protein